MKKSVKQFFGVEVADIESVVSTLGGRVSASVAAR
jgi:hypothetical protein